MPVTILCAQKVRLHFRILILNHGWWVTIKTKWIDEGFIYRLMKMQVVVKEIHRLEILSVISLSGFGQNSEDRTWLLRSSENGSRDKDESRCCSNAVFKRKFSLFLIDFWVSLWKYCRIFEICKIIIICSKFCQDCSNLSCKSVLCKLSLLFDDKWHFFKI